MATSWPIHSPAVSARGAQNALGFDSAAECMPTYSGLPAGFDAGNPLEQPPALDGTPRAGHQIHVIGKVVDGCELSTEHLTTLVEVVQVRPAKIAAGIAVGVYFRSTKAYILSIISKIRKKDVN